MTKNQKMQSVSLSLIQESDGEKTSERETSSASSDKSSHSSDESKNSSSGSSRNSSTSEEPEFSSGSSQRKSSGYSNSSSEKSSKSENTSEKSESASVSESESVETRGNNEGNVIKVKPQDATDIIWDEGSDTSDKEERKEDNKEEVPDLGPGLDIKPIPPNAVPLGLNIAPLPEIAEHPKDLPPPTANQNKKSSQLIGNGPAPMPHLPSGYQIKLRPIGRNKPIEFVPINDGKEHHPLQESIINPGVHVVLSNPDENSKIQETNELAQLPPQNIEQNIPQKPILPKESIYNIQPVIKKMVYIKKVYDDNNKSDNNDNSEEQEEESENSDTGNYSESNEFSEASEQVNIIKENFITKSLQTAPLIEAPASVSAPLQLPVDIESSLLLNDDAQVNHEQFVYNEVKMETKKEVANPANSITNTSQEDDVPQFVFHDIPDKPKEDEKKKVSKKEDKSKSKDEEDVKLHKETATLTRNMIPIPSKLKELDKPYVDPMSNKVYKNYYFQYSNPPLPKVQDSCQPGFDYNPNVFEETPENISDFVDLTKPLGFQIDVIQDQNRVLTMINIENSIHINDYISSIANS